MQVDVPANGRQGQDVNPEISISSLNDKHYKRCDHAVIASGSNWQVRQLHARSQLHSDLQSPTMIKSLSVPLCVRTFVA